MAKTSSGIVAYRQKDDWQFLLVHPGGPFWKNKDEGAWSIPKGEYENEDPLLAALREFKEETGVDISNQNFIELSTIKLKSGKTVKAWGAPADFDAAAITCNTFEMEWPPKSGKLQQFPEVDRAGWFTLDEARTKLNTAQVALVEELYYLINKK